MASRLLTGFALGLLAGVLMAPDKGSETRKKLSQKGTDLKNKFNEFIDSLQHKYEDVKDEAAELGEQAKQKARAFANETGGNWNG